MRIILSLLSALCFNFLFGQQVGAGNTRTVNTVNASDGIYEKFVLIRWEESDKSNGYRLFRASSAAGASLQEITKSWQKSTWFCDYSAEKGRDYYYAVIAAEDGKSAPLSRFDKGFLKKDDKMANDDLISSTTTERVATGRPGFILVSGVKADSLTYLPGSTARLETGLHNIFDEPTPSANVRIYLSTDAVWDFDDRLLSTSTFSSFPSGTSPAIEVTGKLPADAIPGAYHLLVVASLEGNILNAKTGSATINIKSK